jgi:hypothetical protein
MVEYVILIALIVIVAIAALATVGTQVRKRFGVEVPPSPAASPTQPRV